MLNRIMFGVLIFTILFPSTIIASDAAEKMSEKIATQTVAEKLPKSIAFDAKISDDNPAKATLERADLLFHKGSEINYDVSGINMLKESLELCEKAMEKYPENYEVLWRFARGAYKYTESMKGIYLEGWKKACGKYGRRGMKVCEKAQKIAPNRVEAYFWQTACIGKYVDDSGIITAIKEGFFPKSKRAMKNAYKIDKTYYDYSPVFGMGMLFSSPPWPLKDKKKAITYFKELKETYAFIWEDYMFYCYGSELLISLKGTENDAEAKGYLEKMINNPNRKEFYYNWAQKLMKKMK